MTPKISSLPYIMQKHSNKSHSFQLLIILLTTPSLQVHLHHHLGSTWSWWSWMNDHRGKLHAPLTESYQKLCLFCMTGSGWICTCSQEEQHGHNISRWSDRVINCQKYSTVTIISCWKGGDRLGHLSVNQMNKVC